jgi:hypothetical protein
MVFRARTLLLAAAFLALLPSCGKGPDLRPVPITPEDQVYYSDQSQWREEVRVAIKRPDEWVDYWQRITGSTAGLPNVDFEDEMLLLYNAGRRFPGDRIQIMELIPGAEGELVAIYRLEESGTTMSEVFPVQVVRVRRQPGQVRWELQRFDSNPK